MILLDVNMKPIKGYAQSPNLMDLIQKAERKTFPKGESLDIEQESRKANTELTVVLADVHSNKNLAAYMLHARLHKITLLHKIPATLVELQEKALFFQAITSVTFSRNFLSKVQEESSKPAGNPVVNFLVPYDGDPVAFASPEPALNLAMKRIVHRPAARCCRWTAVGTLGLLLAGSVGAAPGIAFPINSQVPPVARVSGPYNFVFSASTFSSSSSPLQYALFNGPDWLQLDSSTRTFSGTPGTNDVGSVNFSLEATDTSGSSTMPVTFVVASDSGPGLGTPVSQQLPMFGTYSEPDSLLLYPSSSVLMSFETDTFMNTNDETVYYAICANNTPLPSWLTFDASQLQLTGTTPGFTSPAELPQTFGVQLIASDVVGFSGAIASFQIVVTSHELTFGVADFTIEASPGKQVNFLGVQSSLTLDHKPFQSYQIDEIVADSPVWLSLDSQNLIFSGIPPDNASSQNFSISAIDIYGDIANATISILVAGSSDLFRGTIGSVQATIGSSFNYRLNESLFAISHLNVSVILGNTSQWLSFDESTLVLSGQVPSNLMPQEDVLVLIARDGLQNQTQNFTISLVRGPTSASGSASTPSTPAATAGSSSPTQTDLNMTPAKSISESTIATAVVVPIIVVLAVLLLLYWISKRRRKHGQGCYLDEARRQISRPYLQRPENPLEPSQEILFGHKRISSTAPQIGDVKRASRFLAPYEGMRQSRGSEHWPIRIVPEHEPRDFSQTFEGQAGNSTQKTVHTDFSRNLTALPTAATRLYSQPSYNATQDSIYSYPKIRTSLRSNFSHGLGHGQRKGNSDRRSLGSPTFSGVTKSWRSTAVGTSGPYRWPIPPVHNYLVSTESLDEDAVEPQNPIHSSLRPALVPTRANQIPNHVRPSRHCESPLFAGRCSSTRESGKYVRAKSRMSAPLESYSEECPVSDGSDKENCNETSKDGSGSSRGTDNNNTIPENGDVLRNASSGQRKGLMMLGLMPQRSLSRASSQCLPLEYQQEQIHVHKRDGKHRTPSASPHKSGSRLRIPIHRLRFQNSKSSLGSNHLYGSAKGSDPPSDVGEDLIEESEDGGERKWEHPGLSNPLRSNESLVSELKVQGLNWTKGYGGEQDSNSVARPGTGEGSGSGAKGPRIVLGDRSQQVVDEGLTRGREFGRSKKGGTAFI
ncbi:hypothetical protein MMC11_008213 [Xylographa trunciseda]|nr:hypothetical protein [Xylographa trunciseda]